MFPSCTGHSTDNSACVFLSRVLQHCIRVSRTGLTGFPCQSQTVSAFVFTCSEASVSVTVYSTYSLSLHLSGWVSLCFVDASVVKCICGRSCFAKSWSETTVKQWQLKWTFVFFPLPFRSQKAQSPLSSSVACWKTVPREFLQVMLFDRTQSHTLPEHVSVGMIKYQYIQTITERLTEKGKLESCIISIVALVFLSYIDWLITDVFEDKSGDMIDRLMTDVFEDKSADIGL